MPEPVKETCSDGQIAAAPKKEQANFADGEFFVAAIVSPYSMRFVAIRAPAAASFEEDFVPVIRKYVRDLGSNAATVALDYSGYPGYPGVAEHKYRTPGCMLDVYSVLNCDVGKVVWSTPQVASDEGIGWSVPGQCVVIVGKKMRMTQIRPFVSMAIKEIFVSFCLIWFIIFLVMYVIVNKPILYPHTHVFNFKLDSKHI